MVYHHCISIILWGWFIPRFFHCSQFLFRIRNVPLDGLVFIPGIFCFRTRSVDDLGNILSPVGVFSDSLIVPLLLHRLHGFVVDNQNFLLPQIPKG